MTLLDPSTGLNIFGRITKSAKEELLYHAKISLKYMQNNLRESFNSLFLQKHPFHSSYDLYICLPCVDTPSSQSWTNTEDDGRCNHDLSTYLASQVDNILRAGILKSGRASRIRVQVKFGKSKSGSVSPLSIYNKRVIGGSRSYNFRLTTTDNDNSNDNDNIDLSSDRYIWCGLVLNPDQMNRLVDRGPQADDSLAAASFRALWGNKAELRRFKDGAIVEAAVWTDIDVEDNTMTTYSNANTISQYRRKKMIIEKVIEHLLAHHQPQRYSDDTSYSLYGYELMPLLSTSISSGSNLGSDFNVLTRHAISVIDKVTALLKSLHEDIPNRGNIHRGFNSNSVSIERLPLRIEAVEPISPFLRYTSAFPVTKHPFAFGNSNDFLSRKGAEEYGSNGASNFISSAIAREVMGKKVSLTLQPLDLFIRTEDSGTWPIEPEALMKAKTAFLLYLRRLLPEEWTSMCCYNYLDVLVEGYAIRLHLFVEQDKVVYESLNLDRVMNLDENGLQDSRLTSMNEKQMKKFKASMHKWPSFTLFPSLFVQPTTYILHHKVLYSLHLHYPTFGSAVRIALAWLSNHRFSNHLSQELVELLVASLYVKPYTNPPHTPLAALLGFLYLLAHHDWKRVPLYINFKRDLSEKLDRSHHFEGKAKLLTDREFEEMDSKKNSIDEDDNETKNTNNYMRKRTEAEIEEEDMAGIMLSFEKSRSSNASFNAMFVVASYDKHTSTVYQNTTNNSMTAKINTHTTWSPTWSSHKPEAVVLLHIINTAKRSLEVLDDYFNCESLRGTPNISSRVGRSNNSQTQKGLEAYQAILPPKSYYSKIVFDGYIRLNEGLGFSEEAKEESHEGNNRGEEWIDGAAMLQKLAQGPLAYRSETLFKNTAKPLHKFQPANSGNTSSQNYSPTSSLQSTLGFAIGFEPVKELICTLEKEMGEYFVFYFSPYSPTKIYFTIRPPTLLPSKFVLMNTPLHLPFMLMGDQNQKQENAKGKRNLKNRKRHVNAIDKNAEEDTDSDSDGEMESDEDIRKKGSNVKKENHIPLLLPNIFEIVNRMKFVGGGLIDEVKVY